MGVEAGHCYEVAQGLTLTARTDDVRYVEGVWTRPYEMEPVPHAWVTVEGYRVDLVGEFYNWKCEDNEWEYEPLMIYPHKLLAEILTEVDPELLDATCLSYILWVESGLEMGGYKLPDRLKHEPKLTQMPLQNGEWGEWGTAAERKATDEYWQAVFQYEDDVLFGPAIARMMARFSVPYEVQAVQYQQ